MQDGLLNFDAASGVVEKQNEAPGAVPEPVAAGLSMVIAVTAAIVAFWMAKSLSTVKCLQKPPRHHSLPYHALSILVASFLGLNVFFGGLSALVLNQTNEDSRAYFADISVFKLARLSHEHFFGYGVSFGIVAFLAFVFVSPNQKKVLVPVMVMFLFAGLDVMSWWLTHFLSFGFHTLSYITGAVFSMCFLFLYIQIVRQNFLALRFQSQGDNECA